MRIRLITAMLVLPLASGTLTAQTPAHELFAAGLAEIREERWVEAESLLAMAYDAAEPATADSIAFYRGFAAYKQGESMARSNVRGEADVARAALNHCERALRYLRQSSHPQREPLERAIVQYVENQSKIIALTNAAG